jgi:hypothetical protein
MKHKIIDSIIETTDISDKLPLRERKNNLLYITDLLTRNKTYRKKLIDYYCILLDISTFTEKYLIRKYINFLNTDKAKQIFKS